MFINLTESRKDKNTGDRVISRICVNITHIQCVQERINPTDADTYMQLVGDKYIFVRESYKDIITMLTNLSKLL